jgi:hypothetical protein
MWDPRTSIVLDVSQRGQEIERKRQVARNQVSKKIQERKGLSHIDADILDPICSSVINVSKAVELERKRQIARN